MTFGDFAVIILAYRYTISIETIRRLGMEKKSTWKWLVCIISAVAALSAAITAFLIVKEKQKKDDEQLEEYLDYSIQ